MLWEGHRERAGFSRLLQAVHLILLQEPLLRARSRLSLAGQGSLPVSDARPVSAVSAHSMSRDRKPYQWETYLGSGWADKKVQNFPFPVQSRTSSHSPQGACEFGPIQPIIFVSTPKSRP